MKFLFLFFFKIKYHVSHYFCGIRTIYHGFFNYMIFAPKLIDVTTKNKVIFFKEGQKCNLDEVLFLERIEESQFINHVCPLSN